MFALGETISNSKIVRKVLRSLPKRFEAKVTAIEESKDIDDILPEELVGNLITFKSNFRSSKKSKNIAFKASKNVASSDDISFDNSSDEEMALLSRQFKKFLEKKGVF
ncbi:hypothetical protein BVC80_1311g8 [Macleaya cordata]|uniref:Gag-pol polyprotein n=1 Tax=Macleaya cordata TaxID=56857 RepID=A0A200QYX8_MACCD|nr:hypothetical protein BVC80_1311g8 [Macleaya cordata]